MPSADASCSQKKKALQRVHKGGEMQQMVMGRKQRSTREVSGISPSESLPAVSAVAGRLKHPPYVHPLRMALRKFLPG